MQFHLNGYKTGDPRVAGPHPSVAERPEGLPEAVDVLIVGCGPAGLVLAAQLAAFPDIHTAVVDRRDGPLRDRPGRRRRLPHRGDVRGLRARGSTRVRGVLGQRGLLLAAGPGRPEPDQAHGAHPGHRGRPVGVPARDRQPGADARLPAGAHGTLGGSRCGRSTACARPASRSKRPARRSPSRTARRSGRNTSSAATARAAPSGPRSVASCVGDVSDERWGVMDVLAVTDFPDIRVKAVINSAEHGNVLIIPREGGYLVRFYIELDAVGDQELLDRRNVTPQSLAQVANRIMHPYTVEVKDAGWWSVYEIGQRLCDSFDDGADASAGVHRRRRLPHAQRQGRPRDERGHGRRLEPRLEAGRRPAGDGPAGAPAHLLRRAPRRSPRS